MLTYTLRRVLYAIPVLLLATFMLFWLVRTYLTRAFRGPDSVAYAKS